MHGETLKFVEDTSVFGDKRLMDLTYFFVTPPIHGYQAKERKGNGNSEIMV